MRALTRFGLSLLPLALLACKTEPGTVVDTDTDVDVDVDIDNDGSPFGEDCDDEDPLRFPNPGGYGDGAEITRVDVPYNHIDDDCGGADGDTTDLVDVDGDGYAGVSFEAYAAEHLALTGLTSVDEVPWTADRVSVDCLDQDGLIILPAPLTAADVNPSATTDPPYDGVDQDCAGDNDFDADGDGFHPTEYASSFADFVNAFHPDTSPFGPASWAPPGGLRAEDGDCLDQPHPALPALAPDTVYPGAVDAPYDGIDANCDGSNDYDADGDGTIATEDLLAFSEYVANWTGTAPGFPNTVTQTIAIGGDCDDTNPTVPALELLFDANDSDCDAHVDATPFAFSAYAWDTPTWPRVVRTDAHYVIGTTALWGDLRIVQQEHVAPALLFAPDSAYQAPVVDVVLWNNVGAAIPNEQGAGVDMVGRPDAFWVSASYFQPDPGGGISNNARLLVREHTYDPGTGSYVPQLSNRVFGWTGHDVGLDLQLRQDSDGEDVLWAMTCGGAQREYPDLAPQPGEPGTLRSFVQNAPVSSSFASQEVRIQFQERPPTNDSAVCFQEVSASGDTALLTSCDEDGCESYDATLGVLPALGSVGPSIDTTWSTTQVREANVNEDLLILVKTDGGVLVKDLTTGAIYDLLDGETVLSADVGRRAGRLFVAAIVDEGGPANVIKLVHTDQPGVTAPVEITLPLVDQDVRFQHAPVGGCDPSVSGCVTGRNLNPTKIGMFVDDDAVPSDDRLVIAVSASSLDTATLPANGLGVPLPQDAVGWVFLGFAQP